MKDEFRRLKFEGRIGALKIMILNIIKTVPRSRAEKIG
jgi:hypothetical protein